MHQLATRHSSTWHPGAQRRGPGLIPGNNKEGKRHGAHRGLLSPKKRDSPDAQSAPLLPAERTERLDSRRVNP